MNGRHMFVVAAILTSVMLALSACESAYAPSTVIFDEDQHGTMAALEVAEKMAHLDATAQAGVVQATLEAQRAQAEVQRIAATSRAEQATAAAWDRSVQATAAAHNQEVQLTANAQATHQAVAVAATTQAMAIEATQSAHALAATQQAEQWNREATATAQAFANLTTATAQARADMATAQAEAAAYRQTATAEVVHATEYSHQATATRAAAIREERLGAARDYGLPILLLGLIGCIIGVIVWGIRQWSKRPIVYERSLLGDAQPMAVPQTGGGFAFVDMDRQPGPVIKVLPTGQVDAPRLRSPGQEERTTARDQAVDVSTRPRLGDGHGSQPALPMPEPPQAKPEGLAGVRVLRRLDQAATAGLLPPGQVEAIEAVWQESED